MKRVLIILFLLIISFNIGSVLVMQWQKYTSHDYWQRFPVLKKVYYDSVYKNKHGGFVLDQILYSYIGGALIKGESPILLNPEVPPFGTYIIGVSLLIFSNEHDVIIIFALMALFMLFLVGKQVFSDNLLALIPPTLFSFELIFKNQLIYTPLLDIMQLVFLLVIFYFFNTAILTKKNQLIYFTLIGVFLGFFIATKFFGSGIPIVLSMAILLLLHRDIKRLLLLCMATLISVVILYANYFQVLLRGYPFRRFLGIQKWIYVYNEGHLNHPFTVWPLIFFNRWYLGDTKVMTDGQWSITWPILISISFLSTPFILLKKNKPIQILFAWAVIYLLLLSFAYASSRYFVILIPVLYIIAVYFVQHVAIQIKR